MRFLLAVGLLAACAPTSEQSPRIDAAFVLAAGDSTFLVESGPRGFEVSRAPILLARLDGRFEELYIVDRDYSFPRALFVSQAVYRRDLLTGDSTLVWEDPEVARIAARYQQQHPGERPLGPDEEMLDDSTTQATTDTELLDAVGPWLNIEFHLDVDASPEPHTHLSLRRVINLRSGHVASLADLTDSASVPVALAAGERLFREARDSVRRATDARAARAREVVGAFRFDPASFELVDLDSSAVVSFFAAGHGASTAGYVLPVGDVPLRPTGWLRDYRDTRPASFDSTRMEWRDTAWTLVATGQADRATATLSLVVNGARHTITEVPMPVRRLYRLSSSSTDLPWRQALRRAFAEWASDAVVAPTAFIRTTSPRSQGTP
ncbi:MAG: hypothetical protein JNJ98_17870 [Gemmatimonadetes bacterium]|nr:hypothetical protein [Gemmatimonadota bacterium]